MNNFLKKFRGKTSTKGFLLIPDKWLKLDLQKHGALALLLSVPGSTAVAHFLFKDLNDVASALTTSLAVYFIGWIIEIIHKYKKNRNYDPYDAHIMLIMSLFGSFLVIFLRFIFYHPYL